MDMLQVIIQKVSILTILPAIWVIIKLSLDYWNMQGVERVLLTNTKFFSIHISKILMTSILFTVIFEIYLSLSENNSINNYVISITRYIAIFFIIFFLTLVVYVFVVFITNLVSIKVKYYIKDGTKWYLVRKLNKDTILLSDERCNYKFVTSDALTGKIFYSEIKNNNTQKMKIFNWVNNRLKMLSFTLIGLIIALLFLSSFFQSGFLFYFFLTLLFISCILGLIIIMIFENIKIIKALNNTGSTTV